MLRIVEEKPGTLWIILGVITFLLNLIAVGIERWEFPYGMVYALGFLAVGLTLNIAEPSLITALSSTIIGMLATWIQISLAYYTEAQTYAAISMALLFIAILGELFSLIRTPTAKYAAIASLLSWFLFPATYFYQRITLNMPLPIETILYHGGVMLLSLIDAIALMGALKFEQTKEIRLITAIAAIIGATLLTVVLGWGLQIYPQSY